jgi:peptidyl-prolyl cis-trans isomerase C
MGCSRVQYAPWIAAALTATLIVACGSKKKEEAASTAEQGAQTIPAYPGAKPIPQTKDGVTAKVDGRDILATDVTGEVQRLHAQLAGHVPPEEQSKMEPMLLKQAIENAVNRKLLLAQAEQEAVSVPDTNVDQEFARFRSQFPDSATFAQQMQGANLDEQTVRARLRENLLINVIIEKRTASAAPVTSQDVETFYRENPEQFRVPEQVRASHILLRAAATDPPEVRGARRASADSILGALKQGADFATIAGQRSEDPGSAARGGDLDFFSRGQMVPAFEAAAFSLAVGQTSGVVETQFGYHILKVIDKKAQSTVSLDEVRPRLSDYLGNQHKAQALQTWVAELRSQAKVEVADSTGKMVPSPPPSAQAASPLPGGAGL